MTAPMDDDQLEALLAQALEQTGPPRDAVDLVKDAFTWRTIDAELMELSFDSALEPAAVRDPDARRSIEFAAEDHDVLVEIASDGAVRGTVVPAADGTAVLEGLTGSVEAAVAGGSFTFTANPRGPVRLRLALSRDGIETTIASETFLIG